MTSKTLRYSNTVSNMQTCAYSLKVKFQSCIVFRSAPLVGQTNSFKDVYTLPNVTHGKVDVCHIPTSKVGSIYVTVWLGDHNQWWGR